MKTPRLTAEKLIKLVGRYGFIMVRQSGSHKIFRNQAGKRITIPCHSRKTLHPKLVSQILKDLETTPEAKQ